MKAKLSMAAVLSTTVLVGGVLLSSASSVKPCGLKYRYSESQQMNWLNSPWAAVVTLPGIVLAAGLYLGGRSYQD